jgi:hypothetical protein
MQVSMMMRSWVWAVVFAVACVAEPADDGGASSSESGPGSQSGPSSGADASSSAAASSTVDSGESGGAPIDLDCLDPRPLLQMDDVTPSGFVACSDDFVHRVETVTCIVPAVGDCDTCATDCSDAPFGRCTMDSNRSTCSCVYGCETDADCGDGAVCACIGALTGDPRCIPASCTTTDDCGGGLCGYSGSNDCEFDAEVACLDASSQCRMTTCDDESGGCVCYSTSFEYVCHDECGSGCG